MGRGSNDWVLLSTGFVLGALIVLVFVGPWPDGGSETGIPTQPFWRFVWQWQTTLAAVAAIAAAAVAWTAARRQVGEMRRQFRHQMAVATARDRVLVRKTVREPQFNLRFVKSTIPDVLKLLEREQFDLATKYVSSFEKPHEALRAWLSSPRTEKVTELLEPEELDAIEALVKQLRRVADYLQFPDARVRADLHTLEARTAAADAAIEALLERVNSWLPD